MIKNIKLVEVDKPTVAGWYLVWNEGGLGKAFVEVWSRKLGGGLVWYVSATMENDTEGDDELSDFVKNYNPKWIMVTFKEASKSLLPTESGFYWVYPPNDIKAKKIVKYDVNGGWYQDWGGKVVYSAQPLAHFTWDKIKDPSSDS